MSKKLIVASSRATGAAAPKTLEPIHDVVHQVRLVREALSSEKRRLGIFLGAGAPSGIYDADGANSLRHLPDVNGLTVRVGEALAAENGCSDGWAKLLTACTGTHCSKPTVEHVLTQIRTICALKGSIAIDGMDAGMLRSLDQKICAHIVRILGHPLPAHLTSYHRFAAWVGQIPRVHPLQVFTPNYDLLVEEAFEHYLVPYFDGFVGTREPFFDLAAIEQDILPNRWVRLWKLHGSLNWVQRPDGSVFRSANVVGGKVMIYPSHLKYDQSRRMPYLALLDRLKAFLRESNAMLICCGYSFADEHLNEVLLDGLRGNRSAHCFALMYGAVQDCSEAVRHAAKHANLSVLARDGAVIATRVGGYARVERSLPIGGSGYQVAATEEDSAEGTLLEAQCLLGDFHHLGLFLENQFGVKTADEHE